MTTWQLFKSSFYKFPNLKKAADMPFWKVILYLFFLTAILALPLASHVFQLLNEFQTDNQKIAAEIPDFHIVDGQLVTAEKEAGFIYQTDLLIFTFDPTGQRTADDVTSDFVGNLFSIGILEDKVVLSLDNSSGLLGSNTYEFAYTDSLLADFDSELLKELLLQETPWWINLIVILVLLYSTLIDLLLTLVLTALGGKIFTSFRRIPLSYFKILKIMVYCLTVPVILAAILLALPLNLDTSTFMTIAALFIFFQALRTKPNQDLPA